MQCPKCDVPMIIVERNNIELDYCIKCNGIWFDRGELAQLSKALKEVDFKTPDLQFLSNVSSKERSFNCPRCLSIMDKVMMQNKPPVIDFCPNGHGFWFEENELGEYVRNNTVKTDNSIVQFLQESLYK